MAKVIRCDFCGTYSDRYDHNNDSLIRLEYNIVKVCDLLGNTIRNYYICSDCFRDFKHLKNGYSKIIRIKNDVS